MILVDMNRDRLLWEHIDGTLFDITDKTKAKALLNSLIHWCPYDDLRYLARYIFSKRTNIIHGCIPLVTEHDVLTGGGYGR